MIKDKSFLKPFLTVIMICAPLIVSAQVTIGSTENPAAGTLLQLKERLGVANDAANATKGLAFPRVALSHKNDLRPMFASGASTAQKLSHTGLVVFNTYAGVSSDDAAFNFRKGLYVWSEGQWNSIATPGVQNGLTINSQGLVELGGTLNRNTSIDMDGKDFSIVIGDTKKMDITGSLLADKLFFRNDPPTGPNQRALAVNINTLEIETAASIPAKLLFAQSADETPVTDAEMRNKVVVSWRQEDIITNNLTTFNSN
jgi:hypothetical protein